MKNKIMLSLFATMFLLVSFVSATGTTVENFQSRYDKVDDKVYFEFDEVRNYSFGLAPGTRVQVEDHKENILAVDTVSATAFSKICYQGYCWDYKNKIKTPYTNPFQIEECINDEEFDNYLNSECSEFQVRYSNGAVYTYNYCPNNVPYKCSEVKKTIHHSIELDMPKKSEINGVGNLKVLLGTYYNNEWISKILEQRL